jgi:crotonobetainyl-CoA:carnitine CoA-transferase CaiB-like acyl-CoA transferase
MESSMADVAVEGVVRQRSGGALPGVAPSNAYPASDGSDVLIAANADAIFARLCTAMERPELADDERYATHSERGANERELDAIIADWTRTRTADDLLDLMKLHSVPAGRVYTAAEMIDDPHYRAREMVQQIMSRQGVDLPTLGVVPKFSRTPGSIGDVGPLLGEHTERHRSGR